MDGSTVADLNSVVAPLNFLVPMAEKPVAYNYDPPPGVPVRTGKGEEAADQPAFIGQRGLCPAAPRDGRKEFLR